MKTLILMRHAKAEKTSESGGDHDRPLAQKGLEQLPKAAARLHTQQMVPDMLLYSDAMRTSQTAKGLMDYLPNEPESINIRTLYNANEAQALQAIHTIDDHIQTLAVVGHNPTVHALACNMVDAEKSADGLVAALYQSFKPGTYAAFSLDIDDWAVAQPGMGELIGAYSP